MGRVEEGMSSPHTSKGLPTEAIPARLGTGNNISAVGGIDTLGPCGAVRLF